MPLCLFDICEYVRVRVVVLGALIRAEGRSGVSGRLFATRSRREKNPGFPVSPCWSYLSSGSRGSRLQFSLSHL